MRFALPEVVIFTVCGIVMGRLWLGIQAIPQGLHASCSPYGVDFHCGWNCAGAPVALNPCCS
jgi:hypothetical protein